jgi:hypothetical protein
MAVIPTPPRQPGAPSAGGRRTAIERLITDRLQGLRGPERARGPEAVRAVRRLDLVGRIKTAISEADIEAQINRMLKLLSAGLIDRTAPRGSYLNFLI